MSNSFFGPTGPGKYKPSEHDNRKRTDRLDNQRINVPIRKKYNNNNMTKRDLEEAIETLEVRIRDMGNTRDFTEDDKEKFDEYIQRLRKLRGLLEELEGIETPSSSHIEEDR